MDSKHVSSTTKPLKVESYFIFLLLNLIIVFGIEVKPTFFFKGPGENGIYSCRT